VHILFITDNFPPETNAPASRTYEHALEWVGMGHEVSVITCVPNFPFGKVYDGYKNKIFQKENMNGIHVYRVWSYMTQNKGFLKRILDFVSFMFSAILGSFRVSKPDVVIATSPQFFSAIAGYVVGKLKRSAYIFEVRDLWPEQIVAVNAMKANIIIRMLFRQAKFLYDNSDCVVTVGEGYKEQIQSSYNVPDSRLKVIPNGIFPEIFSKKGKRSEIRKRLGWDGKFVVIYIGTHGMSQKLETIIDSSKILREKSDILFVFVGEGSEKEKLLSLKNDESLDNCIFYPMQPREGVPELYEAADACIIPLRNCDLFQKNYPSKMFEAMALECPIILSAEGLSCKLLDSAKAGISVPPENPECLAQAILHLNSEDNLDKYRCGRDYVECHYSRRTWAEYYIDIIENVMH